MELGAGFSLSPTKKLLRIDNNDFYIDLLFYHRRLRRLVAIELTLGEVKMPVSRPLIKVGWAYQIHRWLTIQWFDWSARARSTTIRRMEHQLNGNERLAFLLAEVSNGNERAFSELHRLTHAYLYFRALRLLRRPAQAEEVLQEAYLTIWSKARRFRSERGGPMAWMIAIVRNHSVSILRAGRREQECTVSIGFDEVPNENGDLVEPMEEGRAITAGFVAVEHRRLRDGINQLESAQRQSLVLAFDHGLTHVELAEHLNVPLGTVKAWVRRGLARLRAILEPHPCPMLKLLDN